MAVKLLEWENRVPVSALSLNEQSERIERLSSALRSDRDLGALREQMRNLPASDFQARLRARRELRAMSAEFTALADAGAAVAERVRSAGGILPAEYGDLVENLLNDIGMLETARIFLQDDMKKMEERLWHEIEGGGW